ncbi:MAG: hypothetical protein QXJ32_02945 [Thermoplasmata archaeon]
MLSEGDSLGLAAVYSYVACVLLVTHALKGRVQNRRKIVHIMTGGIVFFWWSFDTREVMAGLAAFPFVIVLLLATPRSPFEFLKRSALGERSAEGHPYGLVLYAASWTIIAYALFEDLFAASVAILSMAFGDGMGELVGRKYGRIRYAHNRSLEGSGGVWVATVGSVCVLSWFYFDLIGYGLGEPPEMLILFALSVATFVTVIEALTPGSVDNLVLPLLVAGLLHTMGA